MENPNDSRYPFTYSCDYIRGLAGYDQNGTKLSRSDASQVRQGIAKALKISDDELAKKLADHYVEKQAVLAQNSVDAISRAIFQREKSER